MVAPGERTLRPEDELSHYRIVGPLGAGGMGEVYLAQDRTLERNVALKILPPSLVKSEDRVRRFVLEAKSASSLSHPNIVTIYEIGEDLVRSPGGEPSSQVHFISMELVNGKTLSTLIHEERSDLKSLLGWLAQAADGLAKAHAAGIVHRDLKPGNVMVTGDGFAKVLDFGLAKLTEQRGPGDGSSTGGPALTQDGTGIGTIVGTVGYMAPEQVAGKPVDHRADIFSFGCMLYEAATRRAPFASETSIETMHRILNDQPAPIESVAPHVPAELRRLIRRCLAKNPEQRLQSMKDVAIELREIVDEYETLSSSASSGSVVAPAAAAPDKAPGLSPRALLVSAVAAVVLAAAAWWTLGRSASDDAGPSLAKLRVTTLTERGDVRSCAISADGRYLAYVIGSGPASALRVRQVATGSDVEVVAMTDRNIETPSFTPDGNYLYFRMRRPDARTYSALYQVPSLGGEPRERAFDVDSRATFAPDGKKLLFWRNVPTERTAWIVEYDLETSRERKLAQTTAGEFAVGTPGWSPDGRTIAAAVFVPDQDLTSRILLVDPTSGKRREHVAMTRVQIVDLGWLADGKGLVISGTDIQSGLQSQVHVVDYPGKGFHRVTNDVNTYLDVSAAGSDPTIAALRMTRLGNLWALDADGGAPRPLTRVVNAENSPLGIAVPDSLTLVGMGPRDGGFHLWSLPIAGGEMRWLTSGSNAAVNPTAARGRILFDRLEADGVHVWTMNADGTDARARTSGSGEQHTGISADGRWFLFFRFAERGPRYAQSLVDDRVVKLGDHLNGLLSMAPDGERVVVGSLRIDAEGLQQTRLFVVRLADGAVLDSLDFPGSAGFPLWTPDSRGLVWAELRDANANLVRVDLEGGAPRPFTRITSGRISGYRFSPDGTRLALTIREGTGENVWVGDADGSDLRMVSDFADLQIFDLEWVDGRRTLAVNAGTLNRDVVLVRGFE